MLLLTSLVALGSLTYLAYQSGRDALTEAAIDRLAGIRSAKKQQVEYYFSSLRDRFTAIADAPIIARAVDDFSRAFAELGSQPLTADRQRALETVYKDRFLPELARYSDDRVTLADVWPVKPAALELQSLYIAQNPNKGNERSLLAVHPVDNDYTRVHASYHPWFASMMTRFSLYDLMLIDRHGNIVYTVAKEVDLGGSVTQGDIAGTSLGRLVREVMTAQSRGEARLADFAFYRPSHNAPSGFIAAPVFKDGTFVGVVAGQLSIAALANFTNDNGRWREHGLGESGAILLAGPDRLMRNNHRAMAESPDRFLADIKRAAVVRPQVIERIRLMGSTVLNYPLSAELVNAPLAGRTGTEMITNRRGERALVSFAPLDLPGLNWAIVARMDEKEILAAQTEFSRTVMVAACALVLLSTLLALWLAHVFLRPVKALTQGIVRLKQGDRDVVVENRSRDEFARLIGAFNEMAAIIRERDAVIEGKNLAYEQLLKRIFPDTIAQRMRLGEGPVVETFAQVTVAYAIIDGFAALAEQRSGAESNAILNEIVDRFDAVADGQGVEKIKTIGDHYLAASGLSVTRLDNASRVLDFARLAWRELSQVNQSHGLNLGLRVGIASGSVQAGLVGTRRFVFDIWGHAASVARRIVYEADLNSLRMHAAAHARLADVAGFGEELVVKTKSLGEIRTHQLRLGAAAAVAPTDQAAD